MVLPGALPLQGLARLDGGEVAGDGDEFAGAGGFEAGDGVAGFIRMIGQPFDHAL